MSFPSEELRKSGIPMLDSLNADFSIVPMDALRKVEVLQLWVLTGNERAAPIAKTMERLKVLQAEGKPVSIYVFPDTDHGLWEFNENTDGARQLTRVTDGFYDVMADWAKDQIQNPYGTAKQH